MHKKSLTFAVMLALCVAAAAFSVTPALADDDDDEGGSGGGAQTIVFGSGSQDQFTLNSDCETALQPAVVVQKNPAWADPIPGTQWISIDSNRGAPNPPPFICYQRVFDLPANCGAATLSVRLHVDNDASVAGTPPGGIYLNNVLFGSTAPGPNLATFQDPPEGPYVTSGPFVQTGNQLEFRVHDQGVETGLDYEATLTCAGGGGGDDDDDDDDATATATAMTTTTRTTTTTTRTKKTTTN